jgi:hypothetical protein
VKTQQAEKGLVGAVVICESQRSAVAVQLLVRGVSDSSPTDTAVTALAKEDERGGQGPHFHKPIASV